MSSFPPLGRADGADWNDAVVSAVRQAGESAGGIEAYMASKVLAERVSWDSLKFHQGVDGIAILPGMIQGPPTQYSEGKGESAITGTVAWALPYLSVPSKGDLAQEYFPIVDVRDVAKAIAVVLEDGRAEGRYIVAAGTTFGNDFAVAANEVFKEKRGEMVQAKDAEFRAGLEKKATIWDGSHITKQLGFKYTDKKVTLVDTYKAIKGMQ